VESAQALVLLNQTLAIDTDFATAHAYAAWCREQRFMRGGFNAEDRIAASRHARAAILHGAADPTALAIGGFVLAILEHDHATAVTQSRLPAVDRPQ
jgi:adenylate cyclase